MRSSPTHASTVNNNNPIRSAPVSTRSTKIPSDVRHWYDTESKHDSTNSQYHTRNRLLLNDILKQLYDEGELLRSHIVVLHHLVQQQDGPIHEALLQYQMDGDKVTLVRRLKDVAKNTDPNKVKKP